MQKVRLHVFTRSGELGFVCLLLFGIWLLHVACSGHLRPDWQETKADLLETREERGETTRYYFKLGIRDETDAYSQFWVQVREVDWMLFRKMAVVCINKTWDGWRFNGCRS